MAVTIDKQPTDLNVTNTNLVYVLSSPSSSNAQFRYITDIYESGSGDFITRIRTYPNIEGSGIIDVARVMNDQLSSDYNWKTSVNSSPAVNAFKEFYIQFGEQYAPSYSGSVIQYTNQVEDYTRLFRGIVYKNEGSLNFDSTPITTTNNILSKAPEATSNPEDEDRLFVGYDDYHTITLLNADNVLYANFLDVNGDYVAGIGYNNVGSFDTIGIGPQNLKDRAVPQSILNQTSTIEITNSGTPVYSLSLPIHPKYPCSEEYTRFAFLNDYGFWDYYNVYNPLRKSTKVNRSTYDKTFVRYDDLLSSYNVSDRGTTQYRTEYEDMFTITTDYLSKDISDWLTEMFKSQEVFIQQNGDFVPINILNSDVTWNMDENRQKLFQYEIEFKYANQPQPR